MCLMRDSNVGVCGRGGCTGMVALANGVDVVGCASVEGPGVKSEVTRRFTDFLTIPMPHFFVGVAELQDDGGPSVRPFVESDLRVWCCASQHTYVSLLRSEKQTERDQLLSNCRVGECCTLPDSMWLFKLLILGLNGLLHLRMEDWSLALLVTGELLDGSVHALVVVSGVYTYFLHVSALPLLLQGQ